MKTNQSNITPFLWFNGNVEEAMNFYISIFKNSKILNANHLPGDVPGHKGKVFTATIELDSQKFMLMDGGPQFKFSPAVSFLWIALRRKKWTNCGGNFRKAVSRIGAAGLMTNSA
jgi:predicted 3-demethylubiquinone-9 3-methyltransferase (glyoxalase superfamily)